MYCSFLLAQKRTPDITTFIGMFHKKGPRKRLHPFCGKQLWGAVVHSELNTGNSALRLNFFSKHKLISLNAIVKEL